VALSQTVTIDHQTKRYVRGVSELDRTKLFTIHSTNANDPDVAAFAEEYDVSF